MLQQLETTEFSDIQEDKNYIIHVDDFERYGFSSTSMYAGIGTDIIEKIKDLFTIDEEEEEDDDWFNIADEKNGDGWPSIDVYEVEFLPTRG